MNILKGFTLIEVIIVIAIIGIIAAVVIPAFDDTQTGTLFTTPTPVVERVEKFKEFVSDDCVQKYGEHACHVD